MRPALAILVIAGAGCGTAAAGSARDQVPVAPSSSLSVVLVDEPPPAPASTVLVDEPPLPEPASTAPPASTVASTMPTTVGSAPAPSATISPPTRRVSFAFTGDHLVHSPLWRGAERIAAAAGDEGFDFDPMNAGLRPLLDSVDLAVCHLETPIAPLGEEYSTAPLYGVPEEVVDGLVAAGYERCSTASNHTLDRGIEGIERTIEVLESRGIAQSGMARTAGEIEPTVFDVAGVAVSHLSYTFSYNGLRMPTDQSWRSALIDADRIVADATAARALGAEVVIVSAHWGAEKTHVPTAGQRELADAITRDGLVDLVVGHHAHVVQPIEQVNGAWVMFGLGNVLSNHPTSENFPRASQDAMVVTVEMTVDGDGEVTSSRPTAYPTWVDRTQNWTIRDVLADLADPEIADPLRARLDDSLARTTAIVGPFIADDEIR